jgi:3-oxoacyl-[acyl-carrier protein] reductase
VNVAIARCRVARAAGRSIDPLDVNVDPPTLAPGSHQEEQPVELSKAKAVVTGGGSGMGRAFTLGLAAAGADVVFCDLNDEGIEETGKLAASLSGRVTGVRANVTDENDVARLMERASDEMDGLNVLVNNAGIFRDGLTVKRDHRSGEIRKMSLDQWQAVIDVDLTGPFLCTREFAARVIQAETRPAVIVNMSSLARQGNRGQANYSAAKAGLVADTRLWAVEFAAYGIRTGAIAPGLIETPILMGMPPEELEKLQASVPLGRLGKPEEIFRAVRFIIECEYFTGRCIDLDGGLNM